jgi:hypothetical protein
MRSTASHDVHFRHSKQEKKRHATKLKKVLLCNILRKTIHMHRATSLKMVDGQMDRRELGKVALKVAGVSFLLPSTVPSPANAATRGDGQWAQHKGPFQEKDIAEGFQSTEVRKNDRDDR